LKIPAEQASWTTPLILGGLCVFSLGMIFFAGGMMIGSMTKKPGPGIGQKAPMATK